MDRRKFILLCASLGSSIPIINSFITHPRQSGISPSNNPHSSKISSEIIPMQNGPDYSDQHLPLKEKFARMFSPQPDNDAYTKDYIYKIQNFDKNFTGDIYANPIQFELIKRSLKRMNTIQKIIGHGNFNLISFDDYLQYCQRFPKAGKVPQDEIQLLEQMFYENAERYGFFGEKVITNLTNSINKRSVTKIPYSGHFLFRGDAEKLYEKLKQQIGNKLILTSGIRSIVKQTYLFFNKTMSVEGNLSKASRSLAPPGHSFHGIGDFDVGKIGLGEKNFTEYFAKTDIFHQLSELGYVQIRYTKVNPFGVRYEPWHIKVIKNA